MRDLSTAQRAPHVPTSDIVRSLPAASRHILRGGPEVIAAAGTALGLQLSSLPCRASVRGDTAALWLGPDEQLLLAPALAGEEISQRLRQALQPLPHSLVDISHRQGALQVSGPHAAAVLNAGCPLDLDSSAFPVGTCTRTVLGKTEVVLWRTATDVFHVEVWRSFTAYLWRFLVEASREHT